MTCETDATMLAITPYILHDIARAAPGLARRAAAEAAPDELETAGNPFDVQPLQT